MLKVTGLNKYVRKTQAQKERIRQGATNYVRQGVRMVLRDLVLNVPQWSGDLAASWRIDLNYKPASWEASNLAVDDWKDVTNPSWKGNEAAWREALRMNAEAFKAIRWNAKINIVNVQPLAEYFATEPGAEKKLRHGNFIPGDVMAVKFVAQKYKISSNQLGLSLKSTFNYGDT